MKSSDPTLYLHISNGGVSFKIEDTDKGAFLVIHAGSFGVSLHEMRLPINKDLLFKLELFFRDAGELPLHQHSSYYSNIFSASKKGFPPAKDVKIVNDLEEQNSDENAGS